MNAHPNRRHREELSRRWDRRSMNICTRSEAVGHDLRTGHGNRLKPPFTLCHASTFSDWTSTQEGSDRTRRDPVAVGARSTIGVPTGAPVHPCLGVRLRIAWLARLLSLVPDRRRACAHVRPPACPGAATLKSAPARKCDDKRAEQAVAAENRRLTRTTDPTTISYGYGRQRCRRLRVWRRDRRVRRFGGLQRDNRCLWRCIGNSGAWALRGVGARGARRARAADQVDR